MRRSVAAVLAIALAANVPACRSARARYIAGGIVMAGGAALAVDGIYEAKTQHPQADDGGPGLEILLGAVVAGLGVLFLLEAHNTAVHDAQTAELMKPPAPPRALDCASVRALAADLQARDPAYFRTRVASDPAMIACLAPGHD